MECVSGGPGGPGGLGGPGGPGGLGGPGFFPRFLMNLLVETRKLFLF